MRKVLRKTYAKDYWDKRWSSYERDDDSFKDLTIYPVKFIEPVISKDDLSLDVGCGLGRIVKHYKNEGFLIKGCDYSEVAVGKLKAEDHELEIETASITNLPYADESFNNAFAFGVIHSIEDLNEINSGIKEVWRCLKRGGKFVVSARADNLENRLIDRITSKRQGAGTMFHKWCFTQRELEEMLISNHFKIESIALDTNVSFLHKFGMFRAKENSDESELRSYGFRLNYLGRSLYSFLKLVGGNSFGTTIIVTANKP